ncbi:hypothetical protein F5Y03DRAFT_309502 [Xylaria venustula]|nr:hypothetical protein F5Y03DRAFT_309502 [Xylaria venustula]
MKRPPLHVLILIMRHYTLLLLRDLSIYLPLHLVTYLYTYLWRHEGDYIFVLYIHILIRSYSLSCIYYMPTHFDIPAHAQKKYVYTTRRLDHTFIYFSHFLK